MYRADAFTPFNLNLSARTGSARACARDCQNRHIISGYKVNKEVLDILYNHSYLLGFYSLFNLCLL
jgi:hypothetical protein